MALAHTFCDSFGRKEGGDKTYADGSSKTKFQNVEWRDFPCLRTEQKSQKCPFFKHFSQYCPTYTETSCIKDSVWMDPACGSGSLLLKAEKILGKDAVRNGFVGQEFNITTYNLCRINMFLHDVGFDKFSIAREDTLTVPQHWDDEPFELTVSNPPYPIRWEGDSNPLLINDPRFVPAGILAPKSKADLAFIMHSLAWLAPNGTAAIVCFPGIFYRGGAEQKIRKYLIDNNFIDCVIQLPSNLFFGTSIATCIMVLKKNKTDNKVLFIDASNECVKVTNKNKLTSENIDRIVVAFTARADEAHFTHLASYDEVAKNDYNLSVSTYVEQEDTREKVDIVKAERRDQGNRCS